MLPWFHRPRTALRPARLALRLILPATALVAGCASEGDEAQLTRIFREAQSVAAASTSRPAPSTEPAVDAATPDDYARLAIARNPRVRAAGERADRLAAEVPQARALADPMLMVVPLGAMAETAAGPVETMIEVSQQLRLPAKYDALGEAAAGEAAAAAAEHLALQLDIAFEARQAFWNLWLVEQSLEITRRGRDLLDEARANTETRLNVGQAGQADVLRASTELASIENRIVELELDREVAQAALNRLLGRAADAPVALATDRVPSVPDGEAVPHPRLVARAAEIDAARQRLRLARLGDWPDLTVQATYGFVGDDGLAVMANGDDQWSLGFGINLPIWRGARRAQVRQGTIAVREGEARLVAERDDVAFEIARARSDVAAQRRLIELFDATVLPQARQTIEVADAAYRAGRGDFLTYVDAWRRVLDFELARCRATADLGHAAADLRRALALQEDVQP